MVLYISPHMSIAHFRKHPTIAAEGCREKPRVGLMCVHNSGPVPWEVAGQDLKELSSSDPAKNQTTRGRAP